jgi:hypothetical protein
VVDEPRLVRRFDRSIAVIAGDRQLLSAAAPGVDIDLLPNGVDPVALQQLPPAPADRLRVSPAAIGAVCMIRRQALIEIAGFRSRRLRWS